MELQWQRIVWPEWEVQRCRVAPAIPEYKVLAEGELMARLKWEEVEDELEKEAGRLGFSELMRWANFGRSDPPPGFRYLSRYSDRLAALHNLQLSPVQLRSTDGTTCTLTDATVIAHGHRSLMLRTHPNADFVVKVGSYDHVRVEHRAHAHIDKEDCVYLRKAVPGMHGSVEGAGSGLSFIGLQQFCPRNITAADLATVDGKQKYSSQVPFKPYVSAFLAIYKDLSALHSNPGVALYTGLCTLVEDRRWLYVLEHYTRNVTCKINLRGALAGLSSAAGHTC